MTRNQRTRRLATTGFALAALATTDVIAGTSLAPMGLGPSPLAAVQEDPEESEYREARRAISRGEFDRAVELFRALVERYPQGQYAPDAFYWQAFSQYRMEGLHEALALLEHQLASFPEARIARDARDLELRIRSRLAERGDALAAERVLREAQAALASELYAGEGALGATYAAEAALAQSELVSRLAMRQAEMAVRRMEAAGFAGQLADMRPQEGCDEEDVQHAALQALMRIETDRALPILRQVLARRDECSVPLRKQAVFVLSQHDPEEAEDLMIEVARTDPEPEVREAAVFWLSQVGSEPALDALSELLAESDDPRLQENAIFALAQHANDRAAQLLRGYAVDASKPDRVRERAIFWLGQHADYADAPFMMDLYGSVDAQSLKESVFFALAQMDDEQAVDWMLERALDDSELPDLRKQALFWAGQHESVDLSRLSGLYERVSDRGLKEQLIFLYSRREEAEAVDRLIEVARTETDPELRKRAIFWLGQTGDERAIQALLDLAGDPPF